MASSYTRRRVRVRVALCTTFAIALYALYIGVPELLDLLLGGSSLGAAQREGTTARDNALFERWDLTTNECLATFPGLTREIDEAVDRGLFQLKKMPYYTTGLVQGKIENGKVGWKGSVYQMRYV